MYIHTQISFGSFSTSEDKFHISSLVMHEIEYEIKQIKNSTAYNNLIEILPDSCKKVYSVRENNKTKWCSKNPELNEWM